MSDNIYFWKPQEKYGFLSQWWHSNFFEWGVAFTTAEQYMMYHKALLFGDKESAEKIRKEKDPKIIKELGRGVKGFNQALWDEKKYDIVVAGNLLKFSQDKDLRYLLLRTGDATLAEASPYDKIWGIGITKEEAEADKKWIGENLLGRALMEVRERIKNGTNNEYRYFPGKL